MQPFINHNKRKKKWHITIFCQRSQNLKNHFLLLMLRLFLEELNQLLSYVGGGKLLLAGL